MRRSILIVSMLILVLFVAPIAAMKQAVAKSTPGATSSQAEKGNDDILYLRRSNNLTTTAPAGSAATITVRPLPGNRPNSTIVRWVNETQVPSGCKWFISGGDYNFTFWISKTHQNINVTVTFKFGYINADNQSVIIVSGTRTNIPEQKDTISEYSIIATSSSSATIGSGSRLFIDVNITVGGPSGHSASFYYDGTGQPTQIKTPSMISAEAVSEFPFGVVFLPPALLSAYFILKRRIARFRA